ncbi:MAG: ABC transporter permease [Patescibacteria group bacterium]|nr:ABC transporter permease [Patescibacteria group bacterium]
MIWPSEALLLAGTKLKTRKVRLIITVVITSLLFSVLAFVASLTEGTINSLHAFSREGYGTKLYVQATPLYYPNFQAPGQTIDPDLLAMQKDLITRKKALAKRLDIPYDEKTDQTLPLQSYQNGPGNLEQFPNGGSPIIQQRAEAKNVSIPGTSYAEFGTLARRAGAITTYRGTQAGSKFEASASGPSQVTVLKDGKEPLDQLTNTKSQPPSTSGVASITTIGWRSADTALLKPFILPGQTMVTGKDGSVPVIAPFSAAEEILGLKPLPQTATTEQKLARLTAVRSGIAGKTAQLCYRNPASANLLNQVLQQQKDIANNKNNKDYVTPALLYALPEAACGPTTIKSDTRTADEKTVADHQKQFDDTFGLTKEPAQGIVTIRLIGINSDVNYGPSISPAAVLSSLFTSSVGSGWVSPSPAVEQSSLASTIQGGTAATASRSLVVYYAEFKDLATMETFIKNQTCKGLMGVQGPGGNTIAVDTSSNGDNTTACIKEAKVYTVTPYGNSAGAVEQFKKIIWKVARIAILVVVLIAALIMMGNVGKIIADSRRETAVFRALGAKRFDIAEIYLTYTALVSVLVAICAVILGSIAAAILSSKLSPDLSVSAVLAYNAQDVHKQFVLAGFNFGYVLSLVGLTILAGILSAILPLLGNTRRNPIRDMRDDT